VSQSLQRVAQPIVDHRPTERRGRVREPHAGRMPSSWQEHCLGEGVYQRFFMPLTMRTRSLPVGKNELRVRSRGLPSQRGMERRWGIMTVAIRHSLWSVGLVSGPSKQLAHQPCVLPDSPRWRAIACFMYHRLQTSLPHPPRRFRAKASCFSGRVFVTLQDGHTLQESRGKRHAFLAGNKKALCVGGTRGAAKNRGHVQPT
jgi:hypothetical protein